METISPQKTFTCSRCKRQSAIETVFLKKKHLFGVFVRYYCPDCQIHQRTIQSILYYLVLPLISLLLYFVSPSESLRLGLLWLIFTMLAMIPLIVLHELSHVVISLLLGFHVFRVQLGVGRPVCSKKVLGLMWDVRAVPVGGFTFLGGPPSPSYRLKVFLITLAGPAVHFAIMILSIILSFGLHVLALFVDIPGELSTLMSSLTFVNFILFLSNLWPIKFNSPFGVFGTDGWQLIQYILWKPETASKHCMAYYALMALEAKDGNRFEDARHWLAEGLDRVPNDPVLLNVSGVLDTLDNKPRQARQTFVQLLEQPNLELAQRCLFLNNVAYADILLEDPALLPEADQYSAEAYQHLSWEPAILGTRGFVLVLLGKPTEGLPLLYTALKQQVDPKSKAAECCYIAIGELRLGNRSKAITHLETARQLDPTCPILTRVERELT